MPFSAVASLDLYRQNPFRVTGLPINATAKEIARLTDRLRMFAELGETGEQQTFAFALSPSPDVDQIREAAQALRDPERRLVSGFFWFWPEQDGGNSTDPAMRAVASGDRNQAYELWLERESESERGFIAKHNLAVLFHLVAADWTRLQLSGSIDGDREPEILTYWREALRRWGELSEDERLWDTVKERVRALNEPRLTTGFVRRMEDSLRVVIPKINAEVALKFAELGRFNTARMHLALISEFEPDTAQSRKAFDSLLAPKVEVIRVCLINAKNKSEPNEILAAIRRLIQEIKLQLPLFDLFYPKGAHQRTELFDDAASACIGGIVTYQKATGDDETFLTILREVLEFLAGHFKVYHLWSNQSVPPRGCCFLTGWMGCLQGGISDYRRSRFAAAGC